MLKITCHSDSLVVAERKILCLLFCVFYVLKIVLLCLLFAIRNSNICYKLNKTDKRYSKINSNKKMNNCLITFIFMVAVTHYHSRDLKKILCSYTWSS